MRVGFVGLQVGARDENPVGGKVAARRHPDEVAGHEILGGDLGLLSVADDEGTGGDAAAQALGRGLGAAVKPGVHPDDGEKREAEDRRLAIIAEPAEEGSRRGEEPDHRVGDGVADDAAPSRGGAGNAPAAAPQLFGRSAGTMVTIAGNVHRIARPSTWISTKGMTPR